MVTISEEFVANEQMHSCGDSIEQAPAPASTPVAPAPAPAPAPEPHPHSHPEQQDEDSGAEAQQQAQPKQGRKHEHQHNSHKSQRPKQKRPHLEPRRQGQDARETAPPPASPSPAPSAVGTNHTNAAFPHMEAVSRVLALPVVETGFSLVTGVYSKVKNANPVMNWGLGTAEDAVKSSLGRSMTLLSPLSALSGPLAVVDAVLCRGLDMVEHKVPIITLPPELMVSASRDYVSLHVLAPVMRLKANNVRLADTLACKALNSANHYVDKYLPGDVSTENGEACSVGVGIEVEGPVLQRADRLSRKLQRRLTRRTLLEARALRRDTEHTVHTLVYLGELLLKDPRAFVEQCRSVWSHLSENEPGNQVPPETLEERLALLVREVARRVVHLANYGAANANATTVSYIASNVLKSMRMEGAKVMSYAQNQMERMHMNQILGDVNAYTHMLLERLAHLLAGLRSSSQTACPQTLAHSNMNNVSVVN